MGHAGQAVDQHQHVFTLVAEILGNHMGQVRGFEPQHGRNIGRCCNHHRFGQALRTERFVDESLDLAPALTNQSNHHDIRFREAGHHAQ